MRNSINSVNTTRSLWIRLAVAGSLNALLFASPALVSSARADFSEDVVAASEKYVNDLARYTEDVSGGNTDEAVRRLIEIAEKDGTPAVQFMVANVIYRIDYDASYRLHKKVFEAMPAEPSIVLEWAMERHRKREYAEATALYEKYLAAVPTDRRIFALLADCQVRQGKLKEAAATWAKTEYDPEDGRIELAIHEIYGAEGPQRKHTQLLNKLKQGDASVAESLVALLGAFENNWWEIEADAEGLKQALPLIEKALGKESERYQALKCWADLLVEPLRTSELVRKRLEDAKFILGEGRLPSSSRVASALIDVALEFDLATSNQLQGKFGKTLLERAKSDAGDVDALLTVCMLEAEGDDITPLLEHEQIGWNRYKNPLFAKGLLAALLGAGKLKADSPELQRALKDFPEDNYIYQIAMELIGTEAASADVLAAAIKSEYRKLSNDDEGEPAAQRLNAYFALLAKKAG